MHNTTYIKTLAVALAMAVPAQAQYNTVPQGCYERDYSDAHLAANPDQVVDEIAVKFVIRGKALTADMLVLTAHQGHVAQSGYGGQVFEQILYCSHDTESDAGRWGCGVECDGGFIEIIRHDDKILEFWTDYMMVGETEECGGVVNLAETQGVSIVYRLQRVADSQCSIK